MGYAFGDVPWQGSLNAERLGSINLQQCSISGEHPSPEVRRPEHCPSHIFGTKQMTYWHRHYDYFGQG